MPTIKIPRISDEQLAELIDNHPALEKFIKHEGPHVVHLVIENRNELFNHVKGWLKKKHIDHHEEKPQIHWS